MSKGMSRPPAKDPNNGKLGKTVLETKAGVTGRGRLKASDITGVAGQKNNPGKARF